MAKMNLVNVKQKPEGSFVELKIENLQTLRLKHEDWKFRAECHISRVEHATVVGADTAACMYTINVWSREYAQEIWFRQDDCLVSVLTQTRIST
jgi:hypothetical protein